jgi:20S proteasome alpha/beta subunit
MVIRLEVVCHLHSITSSVIGTPTVGCTTLAFRFKGGIIVVVDSRERQGVILVRYFAKILGA